MADIDARLAESHPSLSRGRVWCTKCGATRKVDTAGCFRDGWPKCCGYTMTIDSPEEREVLAARRALSGDKDNG